MKLSSTAEIKEREAKNLAEDILKARTLMIVSIKNIPSKQFQEIKKSIRKHANVKVVKKNIMLRAIKAVGKPTILEFGKYIESDFAFVISDLEGFELAGILSKKKTSIFAKAGQIALEDVEIKEGPTDLVPGPAISDLGVLGIQVSIEKGKIFIKKSKIVVKEGQIINRNVASLLQKLNIQPFEIGLNVKAVYDVANEKIYTGIDIDSKKYIKELKNAAVKSLNLARRIFYYCRENTGYFLVKANAEAGKLKSFIKEKS